MTPSRFPLPLVFYFLFASVIPIALATFCPDMAKIVGPASISIGGIIAIIAWSNERRRRVSAYSDACRAIWGVAIANVLSRCETEAWG